MSSVKTKPPGDFQAHWKGTLSDYVNAVVWSPEGQVLAASSAAGEVVLLSLATSSLTGLQAAIGHSIECLRFSLDGQFLAAAGQDGSVKIWRIQSTAVELITTLGNGRDWIDRMAWSPVRNQLAFSLGRYVQVWDGSTQEIVTTLHFEASSVLDLGWHPAGNRLAIGGYQGVKIWTAQDWEDDPYVLTLDSATVAIAWSQHGKYLASGNLDRTLTVLEWKNPNPWVMRGFPGKVSHIAWSEATTKLGEPLLACTSLEGIVVWDKQEDEQVGWEGRVLEQHSNVVQAIEFQPKSLLLASAGKDGFVCLWDKAQRLVQVLRGAATGFSCLAWQPQGQKLAAGGENGELLVWSQTQRGQGFGKR